MQYIRIKNWEDFQHYKDRSPKWIKLYRDLLDNYEFTKLTDDGRGHLICIWLLASVMENKIPADAEWIRKRIGATKDIDLDAMKQLGFIELYDSDTEVLQNDTQMWCKTVPREEKSRERKEKEKNDALFVSGTFEKFWSAYPRKVGKKKSAESWKTAMKLVDNDAQKIISKVEQYQVYCENEGTEHRFIKHPATWLHQECWNDDYVSESVNATTAPKRKSPRVEFDAALNRIVMDAERAINRDADMKRFWTTTWDKWKDVPKVDGVHVVTVAKRKVTK